MILGILLIVLSPSAHAILGGISLDASHPAAQIVVSISSRESKTVCSGILIANSAVLTGARCLYKKNPRSLFVTFGTDTAESTTYRGGLRTYVPKQFVPYDHQLPRFKNAWDIGILFFSGSLPKPYRTAKLLKNGILADGESIEMAGFGAGARDGTGVGILRSCSTDVCEGQFSGSELQLQNSDHCGLSPRDAGGPVYRVIGTDVFVYGLSAWGWRGPDFKPVYSVHTKISTYYPWIQAILLVP